MFHIMHSQPLHDHTEYTLLLRHVTHSLQQIVIIEIFFAQSLEETKQLLLT